MMTMPSPALGQAVAFSKPGIPTLGGGLLSRGCKKLLLTSLHDQHFVCVGRGSIGGSARLQAYSGMPSDRHGRRARIACALYNDTAKSYQSSFKISYNQSRIWIPDPRLTNVGEH